MARMARLMARMARLPVTARTGLVMLAGFALLAIVGPVIAPDNPSTVDPAVALQGPSAAHLLGTTQSGQDVLSQLLVGGRDTLLLGLAAGAIATALSVAVGVTAGFLAGIADEFLSLLSNIFLVLPALPLLIVVTGELKDRGPLPTAVVISITGWAWGARVLRAQTLSLRGRDYVLAAREAGERAWRIVAFEIIPNEVAIIASSFVFTTLFAILTYVALAFIGLTDVSTWSWGSMLYWAQNGEALQIGAWWWFIPPGLCVALLGMSLALINFGLDELSDPRLRGITGSGAARGDRRRALRLWRPAAPTPVLYSVPSPDPESAAGQAPPPAPEQAPQLMAEGQP
jgi:peptide/nickel transport system permease protein